MTKDGGGPQKDKAKGAQSGGEKKPYATLDLKATEVEQNKGSARPKTSPEKKASSANNRPAKKKPDVSGDKGTRGIRSSGPTRANRRSDKNEAKARRRSERISQDRQRAAGASSFGSMVGWLMAMLVAGTMGGFIATFSSPQKSSNSANPTAAGFTVADADAISQRVTALENAVATSGTDGAADFGGKLSSLERQLAALQALNADIDTLKSRVGDVEGANSDLKQQLAQSPEQIVNVDRIAKLERHISLMQSAIGESSTGLGDKISDFDRRIEGIEASLKSQFETLKAGIGQDVDTKLADVSRASDEVRAGAARVDHRLSEVSARAANLSESLREVQGDTRELKTALETLQEDLGERIGMLVKPEDMDELVNPLAARVAQLENNLDAIIQSEEARNATAHSIVLSLEIANLKRTIDQGGSFARQLSAVQRMSQGVVNLDPLLMFASTGVPTLDELRNEFRSVAHRIIDASDTKSSDGIFGQMLESAKSIVRIRKLEHDESDNSVEAVVARMERALVAEKFNDVLGEAGKLSDQAREPAIAWLEKVKARQTAGDALRAIEEQLKSSFTTEPPEAPSAAEGVQGN